MLHSMHVHSVLSTAPSHGSIAAAAATALLLPLLLPCLLLQAHVGLVRELRMRSRAS
jgi:hypothetical protein